MNVFVIVDWDEQEVIAVYKTMEDATTHIANEFDNDEGITISEMVVSED